MKKIIVLWVVFFKIFPCVKQDKVTWMHAEQTHAQAIGSSLESLQTYLNNTNPEISPGVYQYSYQIVAGGAIRQTDLLTNTYITILPSAYAVTNEGYQRYLANPNAQPADGSNETPADPEEDHYTELIFIDLPDPPFPNPEDIFQPTGGGYEPNNNPPPCEPQMLNINQWYQFFDAQLYQSSGASILSPPSGIPCTNRFLLAGTIFEFPNDIAPTIDGYQFENNSLKGVVIGTDLYSRAVMYEAIEEYTLIESYNMISCGDDQEFYNYVLVNPRNSYHFTNFNAVESDVGGSQSTGIRKFTGISYTTGNSISAYVELPDNLSGYTFTVPDTTVTTANPGNQVVGVTPNGTYYCHALDCNSSMSTAFLDSCNVCAGGTTGIEPCKVDTARPTQIICDSTAIANGEFLTNMYDSVRNLTDFKRVSDSAITSPNEAGVSVIRNPNGTLGTFNFQTGGIAHVTVLSSDATHNIIGGHHAHTLGILNMGVTPSPGDLFHLVEGFVSNPNYLFDFNTSHDSSVWAILVTDTAAARLFLSQHPNDSTLQAPNYSNWDSTRALPATGASLYAHNLEFQRYLRQQKQYPLDLVQGYANVIMFDWFFATGARMFVRRNGEFKQLYYDVVQDTNGNTQITITICQ